MADANKVAAFIDAARDGKWTRRQTRDAVYHYNLREHRHAIFEALGFTPRFDPHDVGPDGHPRNDGSG